MPDMYNFEADLQVLNKAATGITETAKSMHDNDVEDDWVPDRAALGRGDVNDAVQTFGRRWDLGLNNLVEDTEEAGRVLSGVLSRYVSFDEAADKRMKTAVKEAGAVALPKLTFGGH